MNDGISQKKTSPTQEGLSVHLPLSFLVLLFPSIWSPTGWCHPGLVCVFPTYLAESHATQLWKPRHTQKCSLPIF